MLLENVDFHKYAHPLSQHTIMTSTFLAELNEYYTTCCIGTESYWLKLLLFAILLYTFFWTCITFLPIVIAHPGIVA